MKITTRYNWLGRMSGLPKMVAEAVKLGQLNTTEFSGPRSNPEIIALAKEAGVDNIYNNDETAWCAVAQTVLALRAGKKVPFTGYDRLRAASFLNFGAPVTVPVLGDTLVFKRSGGHHVGIYIGEDTLCYHVAGGNQNNQYTISRIYKSRLLQARRPEYNIGLPIAAKRIFLNATGDVSNNEA